MQKQVQSSKDMHSLNDAGEKKKGRPRMHYIDNIKKWTRGQDYKRFSSMSRCSTHNLCSEMT